MSVHIFSRPWNDQTKIDVLLTRPILLSQLPSKQRQMVILDPNLVKSRVTKQMKSQQKEMSKVKGGEQRGLLLEWFHSTAGLTTKKFYLFFTINIAIVA